MTSRPTISFAKFATPKKGSVFVLAADGGGLGEAAKACDPVGALARAFPVADFAGKFASSAEVLAPEGTSVDRLVAIGAGKVSALDDNAWLKLGGAVAASLRKATEVAVILDLPELQADGRQAASLAAGILLRSYAFDKYKTRKDKEDGQSGAKAAKPAKVTIHCVDPAAAKKAFTGEEAVVDGVLLARDLVNEPANVLGPVDFAERVKAQEALG
ncbi:MAG: leucyl aminopeptidase, partial [Mesorhizobium sp.]